MKKYPIVRFKRGERESLNQSLPVEKAVTILLNEEEIVTLLATPDRLKELAVGFLYSEGILGSVRDLKKVLISEERSSIQVQTDKNFTTPQFGGKGIRTSGCGKGITFSGAKQVRSLESNLKVAGGVILNLMKMLFRHGGLYKETGGVHTSALADKRGIISLGEDIGRHNTFDKILGECFLSQIRTEDKLLLTTGRVSSEMLLKAATAKIPVISSHTSPTNLAVELAETLGVTLIGYARGGNMRIYSHSLRIV